MNDATDTMAVMVCPACGKRTPQGAAADLATCGHCGVTQLVYVLRREGRIEDAVPPAV